MLSQSGQVLINLLPSFWNVILTFKWVYCRCRLKNIPAISLQSAYWLTELKQHCKHFRFPFNSVSHNFWLNSIQTSQNDQNETLLPQGLVQSHCGENRAGEGSWLGWKSCFLLCVMHIKLPNYAKKRKGRKKGHQNKQKNQKHNTKKKTGH